MRRAKRFFRFVPLLVVWSPGPVALAEMPVAVGVRGGIHLIDWYQPPQAGPSGSGTDESSKGIVGPFVSVKINDRFAVQVEGLRRGYGFTQSAGRLGFFTSHEESGSGWEIPALLVWRPDYQENGWQPYIGVGPGVRYVSASFADITRRPQLLPTDPPASETRRTGSRSETKAGAVATAGMERRFGPVAFSAELRYAWWSGSTLLTDVVPKHNQVSILFGVRTGH